MIIPSVRRKAVSCPIVGGAASLSFLRHPNKSERLADAGANYRLRGFPRRRPVPVDPDGGGRRRAVHTKGLKYIYKMILHMNNIKYKRNISAMHISVTYVYQSLTVGISLPVNKSTYSVRK